MILTLAPGQCVRIGDDIIVSLAGVRYQRGYQPVARIGVAAPPEVVILREELVRPALRPGGGQGWKPTSSDSSAGGPAGSPD